jgi:putative PEP-CTERM system TPR-repeat lipoprotein
LRTKRAALTIALISALALVSGCNRQTDVELLASAQSFLAKEDRNAAIVQLKSALQLNPNLPEARFLLGEALLQSGDMSAALVELEKAQELKFDENKLLPSLARALMGTGQAKKVTDQYSRTRLSDALAHSELKTIVAAAFGAQGQIDRSQASVDMALQLDPKNVQARLLRARLTAGRGQVEEALKSVDEVLAENSKRRDALHLKGELLWMGQGNAQGGAEVFRQTLAIDPRYMPAHSSLISIALQKGDIPAFKLQLAQLKEALPNSPETRLYEAQGALIDRDHPRARELTQQLLQIAPENHLVLQLAGAVEMNGGSAVLAEAHLNKALQLQPQLQEARRLLAQIYVHSGQAPRALTTLQPLLQGQPSAVILALAGEAQLQNGDLEASEALFTRAAQTNPNDTKSRTALALAQVAKGNVDRGLADLEALTKTDTSTYADLALISAQLRRQNADGALAAIDRLQAKIPKEALPHELRGRVLAQRKDIAGARASFERALQANASYFPAVASLAALDVADKKPDSAVQRYQALLAREPKNYRALLAVAELKLKSGAPAEEVRTLLTGAVQANPGEAAPRLLLVDFLLSRNEAAPARAAAQNAVAAVPTSLPLQDALGRAQLAAGEVQQAISSFTKLAAAQPMSVPGQLRLAQAHAINKDYADAKRSLRRALELDPMAIQASAALVEVALGEQRFDEALQVAQDVQKQSPKAAIGYLLETDVHASRRQWAPAISALQAALERHKTTPTAMRLHGLLSAAGRGDEAERMAANWLREQPRDAQFIFHLGSMAMDSGRYAEAETQYRRVLTLRPEDATALNNIAWVMTKQSKPGAVAFAEQALKIMPEQPALMDTLASALVAEGQLPQAIDWQRKALAKAGNNASYRLRLAKMLIQTGDKTGARTELNTLTGFGDKFADHAEVQKLLKTL